MKKAGYGWALSAKPGVIEDYNSTGALYACLPGLVHLGLTMDDPVWAAPAADWTQRRVWAGDETIQGDQPLDDLND